MARGAMSPPEPGGKRAKEWHLGLVNQSKMYSKEDNVGRCLDCAKTVKIDEKSMQRVRNV